MEPSLQERYRAILAAHLAAPDERHLLDAATLGRDLVLRDVPPEEMVELHEQELERLAAAGQMSLPHAARLLSEPLMEIFVAYGLAFRDRIESLRKAEADVRESRAFLSTVIDTAAALVVVVDRDGRIVRVNPACERATGWPAADLEGKVAWEILVDGEHAERLRASLQALTGGGPSSTLECAWRARDGALRLISSSSASLHGPDGAVKNVVIIGIDVSHQRLIETQAHHRERLAAAGQLAAGFAHEIGNPLAAISGVAEILRGRATDGREQERLDIVIRQVDRITVIVRQMLDLSRPPRQVREACDLNAIVTNAVNLLRYDKRGKNVAVELDLDPAAPRVMAVEDRLLQVFVNIGLNALDALRGYPEEPQPRLAVRTVRARTGGNEARAIVTFEDNGPGIAEAVRSRLFQPFVTSKATGTGLGLAVCRTIVREHGGDVTVEDADPRGARFRIELPAG